MKRTLCIFLIALLGMSLVAGCQKAPESPIVVGKDTQTMIAKAQGGDPQPENGADAAVDLYARLGAPKNYTADIVSKGGKLTVHVDANVELPDCELPIIRIKPVEFSMEQAKMMAAALFGDTPKYVEGIDKKTKGALEGEIEKLRVGIADWEALGTYLFDLVYETKEEAEKALNKRLQEAAVAPESLPAITPDFSWRQPEVWTEEGQVETTDTWLTLWTMPDDRTYSWFMVNNSRQFSGNASVEYNRDFEAYGIGKLDPRATDVSDMLSITEQAAYALAVQTAEKMGLSDFICTARQGILYRVDPAGYSQRPFYAYMFTRQHFGVAETYTNDTSTNGSEDTLPWYYEQLQILIDDEGVAFVRYSAPSETVETVMPAAMLMPFDQIQGIFEKMVVIVDNVVDTGIARALDEQAYVITTVRLGLMSVREQNADTGLVIPVWDFLGHEELTGNKDSQIVFSNELKSFLTINAIDGSVIQRGYGY